MLFAIHGISHGLGLAVHDPMQGYYDERVFRPGDAFTIEPGIYVNTRLLDILPDTPRNRNFSVSPSKRISSRPSKCMRAFPVGRSGSRRSTPSCTCAA